MVRAVCRSFGLAVVIFVIAAAEAGANPVQGPSIKFDLVDGAKVSDLASIVARVTPDGDVGIDKVEFAVDDKVRVIDTSTPYAFDMDTLEETEGTHSITATAFDAKGRTARAKLTINIDNELSKGADSHAEIAIEALKANEIDRAQRHARRALKLEPSNFRAALALSRLYRASGDQAKAVAVLDKAAFPANEIEARKELVALHMSRADEGGSTEAFLTESLAAIEVWKKINEIRVSEAKLAAGEGPNAAMALGDALFAAHDFQGAILQYRRMGSVDSAPIGALNRQLMALVRSSKPRDADQFLRQIKRGKREDETTLVLEGMVNLVNHKLEDSRAKVVDAAEGGSLGAKLVLCYANLSVRKTSTGQSLLLRSQRLAEEAVKAAPESAEAHLALAFAHTDAVDSRRALVRALELDPTLPEAYALWSYNMMLGRDRKRFESADMVLDHALNLDPNNTYVLMAKVVSLLSQKRPQEAEPLLEQILKQDPEAPDAHVAQALNFSFLDRSIKITAELNLAFKLDPERWSDVFVPKPTDLLSRVYRYRYLPVLSPSVLAAP